MDEQSPWCCLLSQLGITSTAVACTGYMACFGTRDEAPPDGTQQPPPGKSCFDCGAGREPPVLLTLLVAVALLVPRRRRVDTKV
jgi:MYXO-CTERM domain-containing protein